MSTEPQAGAQRPDQVVPPPYRRATSWFTDRNWAATLGVERLQRSRAVGRGVRVAMVLPIVVGGLSLLGRHQAGFLAAFAVITLLVTSDFSGPRPERAASMATIATAGAVTLVIGVLLNGHPWALVVTALLLGMAVALFGALRGFLAQATVPTLLPFFLGATTTLGPNSLINMVGGWLLGSAVAIVAAVTMWPYFPRRQLVESLVTAMRGQADAVDAIWAPGADPASAQEAFTALEHDVDRTADLYSGQLRRPGSAYRRERFIVRLVEEMRRMRIGVRMAYRQLPLQQTSGDREVMAVASQSLRRSAAAAKEERADLAPFRDLDAARDTHRESVIEAVRADLAAGDGAAANQHAQSAFRPRVVSLHALTAVRDAGVMYSDEKHIPHLTLRGARLPTVVQHVEPWQRLRAQLSWNAPWMLNALRVGIAVAVSLAVVQTTGSERGYWVVLGTMSVLRMDLRGTGRTSWQVIQGQLLGFVLGGLLVLLISAWPAAAWLLLPVLAGLMGYMANNAGLIWQQAGFTLLLVDLVSLSSDVTGVTLLRLEDVALGMVVAIVVSVLVFPRGLAPRVRRAVLDASDASAAYLESAVALVARRMAGLPAGEQPTGAKARAALELASETIDLSLAQGVPQGVRTQLWRRMLVMCEYITYLGEIISAVGTAYPDDLPSTRVGADLLLVTFGLRPRLEENTTAVLDTADRADKRDSDRLPDYPNTGEYTPEVTVAQAGLEAAIDAWAADRRAEMADPAVELSWILGWLGEVDLMIANNEALLAELDRPEAATAPTARAATTA